MEEQEDGRVVVTCGVCGGQNEPGARFCGSCGSALPVADGSRARPPDGALVADEIVVPGRDRDKAHDEEPDATGGRGRPPGPPAATGTAGAAIEAPASESPGAEPGVVCGKCGTLNDLSRVYCRRCATELRPQVTPVQRTEPSPRPRVPLAAVAVAALAVVVLLVGGAFVLGLGGPGPGPSATSPADAASPDAAATAATSVGPSPTAEPTASVPVVVEGDPPPGRIAYAAGRDNLDIFIVNADGTGSVERLTATQGHDRDPAFSPDCSEIVYASGTGLRVVTVDTGRARQVTRFLDANPFWSPVEDVLVFAGKRGSDPELEIFRYVLGEERVTRLTDNQVQDHDPVWSPDGSEIAWVFGADDARELMIMDGEGQGVERLTNDDENDVDPAFAPTGDRLVFASKRGGGEDFDLFIFDLTSRRITQITDMDGDEHDPAWSPGGRYIAFHQGPVGDEDLFILDTTDGRITPLVQSRDREILPAWC